MTEATETAAEEAPPATTSASGEAAAPEPPTPEEGAPTAADTTKDPDAKEVPAPPPTQPDVNRMERAKAAAARMSAERKQRDSAMREASASRYALQQRDQEIARLRQENEQATARLKRVESDPVTYLRDEKRMTADDLAKQAIADSDPEVKLQRMQARLDAAEERDRERERKADERQRQQQQAAQMDAAKTSFLAKAVDAETYPNVAAHAEVRPQAIVREALEVIEEAHNRTARRDSYGQPIPGTGHVYSDEEALEYLEAVYAKAAGKSPTGNGAPLARSNAGSATQSGTGSRETTNAGKPRTLSGKDAGQSSPVPKNFDDMSDAEQKRWMADEYKRRASK